MACFLYTSAACGLLQRGASSDLTTCPTAGPTGTAKRRGTAALRCARTMEEVCEVGRKRDGRYIRGKCFVVRDNIDTDQIIPAEYLTLVPSNPEEYAQLGSYAMIGLPDAEYTSPYVTPGTERTEYEIIIGGDNFGCGSSREHAPIAIGAAGGKCVIAESYARIFFRNCSATGELYPIETPTRLVDKFKTGDQVSVDFDELLVTNERTGESYKLNDLGDVLPVVDAGGIFEFARRSGMIESAAE